MSWKRKVKNSSSGKYLFFGFILPAFFVFSSAGQVSINCVLATVNEKPITLFDLKIMKAFNLISEDHGGIYEGPEKFLEVYIDQILVRDLTREQIKVSEAEIKEEMEKTKKKLGMEDFNRRLVELGLSEADLYPYYEGKILFDKVIGSRFAQKSFVSLREIEEYYQNEYLPQQRARGEKASELYQVLDELETRLQRAKRSKEIKEWIDELKQRADIIINPECLKKWK